jgi:hypothetical protein
MLAPRGINSLIRGIGAALALVLGANGGIEACAAQAKLSEHAVVAQTVAGTTITVEYSRPQARGRDSLFGKVVKWGSHWTPGADWATTVETDRDVRVNGAALPKGKYSVWAIVEPKRWTLEFRRTWHKFHVPPPTDSSDVALRLTVPPQSGPATEVLTFDFPVVTKTGTTLRFRWGTVEVPLEIGVAGP